MKLFKCQVCDNILYFENRFCGKCGHRLGYEPESRTLLALEPSGSNFQIAGGGGSSDSW